MTHGYNVSSRVFGRMLRTRAHPYANHITSSGRTLENTISERRLHGRTDGRADGWMGGWEDGRMRALPVRRLKERRASTRYGVSLLERSLRIGLRSVLLSGTVAINLNQCPAGDCWLAGRPTGGEGGRAGRRRTAATLAHSLRGSCW